MKLTGDEDEEILRAEAKEIVLRQLAMMDRTRHQLMRALTTRNVPADIAEQTVDRYQEHGLVDELQIFSAPVMLGDGTRAFDVPGGRVVEWELMGPILGAEEAFGRIYRSR